MQRPNLFVVGAPKCGTTSLCKVLGGHEYVYMASPKEPHYFTAAEDGGPAWGIKSQREYEELFRESTGALYRGEASTWYLYSATAAGAISEYNQKSKIIIFLRDPVWRAYSAWSFNHMNGWERRSFEDSLEWDAKAECGIHPWDLRYLGAGCYASQIARYLQYFPRESVLVLLFEEVFRERSFDSGPLERFLGLQFGTASDSGSRLQVAFNRTMKRSIAERVVRTRGVNGVWRKIPSVMRRQLKAVARRTIAQEERYPPPGDAVMKRLREYFRPAIEETSTVLGRDLREIWG